MNLLISLVVLAFSTLVVFSAAAPAVQDIVPEETLLQHNIHQTPKLSIMEFLQGTIQHARSDAEVISLLATKMKQEPESIKALNDAIELIINDVVKSHKAAQKLINEEIDSYSTCAAMPLVDQKANDNAAKKFLLIKPAQNEQDDAATGKINYDFGKSTAESAIAAIGVKTAIDAYKKLFDDAYNRRENAQKNYSGAQTASNNADIAKTKANHQCYCAAKKAYDAVTKAATTSNKNDKTNLKHFQMIQCVMAEFAKDSKAEGAFTACRGKSYEDKVVTLNFRKDDAALDDTVKCGPEVTLVWAELPKTSCITNYHYVGLKTKKECTDYGLSTDAKYVSRPAGTPNLDKGKCWATKNGEPSGSCNEKVFQRAK